MAGFGVMIGQGHTAVFRLPSSLVLLAFVLAAACGGASSTPAPRFLSIATGGTGGVYYPYGGAIARLVSEIPGVQATAEVTGASVDNLKLLQLGKVDLAFTLADTLAEAVAGTGPFKETGAVGSVRTLAVLYTNYTHVAVRKGSGITTIADLRGKTVSVGSPGSGTELIADRLLAAAGLDPRKDITRHALGAAESTGAMKDGKLDAFFWSGGVPTPAVQDLASTPGFALMLVGQADGLRSLQSTYGRDLYRLSMIPAGLYRGVDEEVPVVGVTNLLVGSSSLDDDIVGRILAVMFDRKSELVAAHPEAIHLALPSSRNPAAAPLHSGAEKFYRSRGLQ